MPTFNDNSHSSHLIFEYGNPHSELWNSQSLNISKIQKLSTISLNQLWHLYDTIWHCGLLGTTKCDFSILASACSALYLWILMPRSLTRCQIFTWWTLLCEDYIIWGISECPMSLFLCRKTCKYMGSGSLLGFVSFTTVGEVIPLCAQAALAR